jgi:hypothetical protein
MKKVKYILIPVLVTLVVLVVSLYPTPNVTREVSAAPRAAVVTKYLMIPAAAFNVVQDGKDYVNYGRHVLFVHSSKGAFVAPVYLPHGARIRMIKLFAVDNSTEKDLCAKLNQLFPNSGGAQTVGQVCTTGSSGIQQSIKNLSYYVKWYYGYYIWLHMPVGEYLSANAVMIKYTINQ